MPGTERKKAVAALVIGELLLGSWAAAVLADPPADGPVLEPRLGKAASSISPELLSPVPKMATRIAVRELPTLTPTAENSNRGGAPMDAIEITAGRQIERIVLAPGSQVWLTQVNELAQFEATVSLLQGNNEGLQAEVWGPEITGDLFAWGGKSKEGKPSHTGALTPQKKDDPFSPLFWTGANIGTQGKKWFVRLENQGKEPKSFSLLTNVMGSKCNKAKGRVYESLDGGKTFIEWQLC